MSGTRAEARTDELFRRFRASGSVEERNALVVEYAGLADAVARRFSGRGEPDDDLRQVARLALVQAVERYDPDRGIPFRSFAVPSVLGSLKRHFRDRTWSVTVSRRLRDLGPSVREAEEALRAAGVHRPTVEDVAAHLGVDPELVIAADEVHRARRAGPLDEDPDDPVANAAIGADPGEVVADRRLVVELLSRLSARDRRIVVLAFYREWTQQRIAEDVGLSQEQVSRVIRRALRDLGRTQQDV